MKKLFILPLTIIILFNLSGCGGKPSSHPKHPNYNIKKPKIKYKPSKKSLAKMVKQLQGSPYVWAEEGPNQFDCSGFTYYMYGSMGIEIPRVARDQAKVGQRVSPNKLQYGDLIFFATSKRSRRKITHVGMYLGNGWFTHASTVKNEVIYSNLFKSKYYKNKLRVCRRYLPGKDILQPKHKLWEEVQVEPTPNTDDLNKAIVIKAPLTQISSKGNFYVQIGSYIGNPKSSIIQSIQNKSLSYIVIRYTQAEQIISKILIGPYHTKLNAQIILQDIKVQIAPDAFIAEIR